MSILHHWDEAQIWHRISSYQLSQDWTRGYTVYIMNESVNVVKMSAKTSINDKYLLNVTEKQNANTENIFTNILKCKLSKQLATLCHFSLDKAQ